MKEQIQDFRIPMKPRTVVEQAGSGARYVVEGLSFKTRFSLAYQVHREDTPSESFGLMELYPRSDGWMGGLVQRMDNGAILIHNPFSALFGPTDQELLQTVQEGLVQEIPGNLDLRDSEWFVDAKGCHYLSLRPGRKTPESNPLPLIPEDELASYLILKKHPLYRYREDNGDIHVLCLGSGVFMQRMILSILSCGQMPRAKLHIHVVSNGSRETFVEGLLRTAPLLKDYAALNGEQETEHSVIFHYQLVSDVLEEGVILPDARYVLISLGDPGRNRAAARALAQKIQQNPALRARETVISYYAPRGKAAAPFPGLSRNLTVDPFSEDLSGYGESLRELGRLTARLAHLYNKLGNPRISLEETTRGLADDEYGQRSSCASALHLNYKLAGIGIDPAGTPEEIIAAYETALGDERYNLLLANEHNRWLYYMMADRYTAPTEEQLLRYGFETDANGSFNKAWRYKPERLHPCMVPCRDEGMVLTKADFDEFDTREKIDQSSFDPLDKVSLKLHLLAKEKCGHILAKASIPASFRKISEKLDAALRAETEGVLTLENLKKKLEEIKTVVCANAESLQYSGHALLEELQRSFEAEKIDISGDISGLKKSLSVFVEYAAFRDYKDADEAIVRQLPWILFGDTDVALIMMCNPAVADRIATPLLMDPAQILFFGTEDQPQWSRFLKDHGCRGEVSFIPCVQDTEDELLAALRQEVDRLDKCCVIDVTGAAVTAVLAAKSLYQEDKRVCLIHRTAEGTLENVRRYPVASVYKMPSSMTAEDVFALHGAEKKPDETHYMEQLYDMTPVLWQFYRDHQNQWNMISAFFDLPMKRLKSEMYIPGLVTGVGASWDNYSYSVDPRRWNISNMAAVLKQLENGGVVKNFRAQQGTAGGPVRVLFSFPRPEGGAYIRNRVNGLFESIKTAVAPYGCKVTPDGNGRCGVEVFSGRRYSIRYTRKNEYDEPTFRDKGKTNNYPYSDMEPILSAAAQKGILSALNISDMGNATTIEYAFAHPALLECLNKSGNILELYIWYEARRMHFFDDVQSNFSFYWNRNTAVEAEAEENQYTGRVSNELDVVMTRGMASLIVSAKTSAMNKEHLYELGQLVDRFSVNSIPVIVYSSDRAYEDGKVSNNVHPVKERAKAMGVYLIDLNELEDHNCTLGEKLVRIAKKDDQP